MCSIIEHMLSTCEALGFHPQHMEKIRREQMVMKIIRIMFREHWGLYGDRWSNKASPRRDFN
jgi:hypothetical protein